MNRYYFFQKMELKNANTRKRCENNWGTNSVYMPYLHISL